MSAWPSSPTETVSARGPGSARSIMISNFLISSGDAKGARTQPVSGSAPGSPTFQVTSGSVSIRVYR